MKTENRIKNIQSEDKQSDIFGFLVFVFQGASTRRV